MKKSKTKRILATFLALTMTLGIQVAPVAAETAYPVPDLRLEITPPETPVETIGEDEIVTVIVEMQAPTTMDDPAIAKAYADGEVTDAVSDAAVGKRAAMVSDHEVLQNEISELIPDAVYRYHYTNLLNGFAARIPYGMMDAVKALNGVEDVYVAMSYAYDPDAGAVEEEVYIPIEQYYAINPDADGIQVQAADARLIAPASDQGSMDLMGVQAAWDKGYTGAGKVAAVFDSGFRYTHEFFSYMDPDIAAEQPGNYKTKEGLIKIIEDNHDILNLFVEGWGSWYHGYDESGFSKEVQHEILSGGFYYNEKVPFRMDYADGDTNTVHPTSSHGTHVAGIVAGNAGPNKENGIKGSAYDAQIYFFKVFPDRDTNIQESDEAVFAALDDAVTLGANTFNLSLGIKNGFTTMNTYAQAGYQKAYNRAKAAGITVCVSAGNDYRNTYGSSLHQRPNILPNYGSGGFSGTSFAPLSVASNVNTNYRAVRYTLTNTVFTDSNGQTVYETVQLRDNNPQNLGTILPNSAVPVVSIGSGTVQEILAATGETSLEGALTAKVALIEGGNGVLAAQENAYNAGAAACLVYNAEADKIVILTDDEIWNSTLMPVIGMMPSSQGTALAALAASQEVYAGFTSGLYGPNASYTGTDSGPSAFTSWGVTEALKLHPEIMAPGGNIYSSTAGSDTSYGNMSGTSMASPNLEGVMVLLQQAVDDKIAAGIFDVQPGTHEYSELVDMLAASTAKVYSPNPSVSGANPNVYFSPRQQGAGQIKLDKAIESNVILHNRNTVAYDPVSGEQPRTKVELGDKLGEVFTVSFMADNYNNESRRFNVSAVLQTDTLTRNANTGKLSMQQFTTATAGTEVDPLSDAVMTVKSVNGGSIMIPSNNINRYRDGYNHAGDTTAILVPANASVEIVIEVDLRNVDTGYYDARFPNGMFLDGFVWLESNGYENVNIPFFGFRGDFTQAPIFDLQDAYTPITALDPSADDYPMYHSTSLATVVNNGELVLGANQYTGAAWPGFRAASRHSSVRTYFNNLHNNGNISEEFIAISPDEDGFNDFVYANLALIRNAKAIAVVIRDEDGNAVKVMGPEYEYFQVRDDDSNLTQQIAATHGTKYLRDLSWDGTDENGAFVPDGQYYYEVRAMVEYEYLNTVGHEGADEEALQRLLTSDTVQTLSMPVKVDTTKPYVTSNLDNKNQLHIEVSDASGIQALAIYYKGAKVDNTMLVNETAYEMTLDLDYLAEGGLLGKLPLNPALIQIQAVDYAMNLTNAFANETVGGELAPVEKVTVVAVAEVAPVVIDLGSGADEIALPEAVEITLSDERSLAVSVKWDEDGFDLGVAGEYTIDGELELPDGIMNPEGLSVQLLVVVTLEEDQNNGGETTEAVDIVINGGDARIISKKETVQLSATVTPLTANQEVVWSSSNTNVLTVDEDGLMTGVGIGMARVTAETDNGLNYIILVRIV